jgi:hypothetical protein
MMVTGGLVGCMGLFLLKATNSENDLHPEMLQAHRLILWSF